MKFQLHCYWCHKESEAFITGWFDGERRIWRIWICLDHLDKIKNREENFHFNIKKIKLRPSKNCFVCHCKLRRANFYKRIELPNKTFSYLCSQKCEQLLVKYKLLG